jgi:hypothetical protein
MSDVTLSVDYYATSINYTRIHGQAELEALPDIQRGSGR